MAGGSWFTVHEWQAGRMAPPTRVHLGTVLLGWGESNLVEGVIDHQLLGVHHVRDDLGGPIGWDLGSLAFGALLNAAGMTRSRQGAPDASSAG